jgi:hypothetical protein
MNSTETRELLLNFENMGRNCEFGLLQRYAGAEPLGLLRWSSVAVKPLIHALQERFEGFGTEEQSEIVIERGEYWIKDTKFKITSHTSIRDVKADIEYVRRKQLPHLKFLREGLIEKLENAEKIFVYQHRDLARDSILELHRAILSYGPNLLLCVRTATGSHMPGDIETVGDNLMVGYIDREGIPSSSRWDLSTDLWMQFAKAAFDRWKALGYEKRPESV